MRNTFLTALLAVGLATGLRADDKLYLLYDSDCMEKHESWFTRSGIQTAGEAPLVQYALAPNRDTRVYLEMSGDRPKPVNDRPKNTKTCSEIRWDDGLLREINSGKTDLFLIWKTNSGWSTATVATAALQTRKGSWYEYRDREFNFKIDTAASFQADDLADSGSNFFVTKKDLFYRECEPVWVLKRDAKKACDAYTEFEFIPRYGIVKENTGKTAAEASENQLDLFLVDGKSFIDKLKAGCGVKPSSAPPPVAYSNSEEKATQQDRPNQRATQSAYNKIDEATDKTLTAGGGYREYSTSPGRPAEYAASASTPSRCTLPEKSGYHLVQKDENLYRIARQYGLSVANLKAMNDLTGDNIAACSYLAVEAGSAPIAAPKPVESSFSPQKTAATTPPSKQMTAGGGVRILGAAAKPETYSTPSPTPKPAHVVKVSTDGWHVIEPDENLTVIGAAYGFTATDLAKLNGIARNTILYPGQKLRVSKQAEAAKAVSKPMEFSAPQPVAVQQNSDCYHYILEGDNLSKIARTYGYTLDRLMRMNGIIDEKMMLQVGQRVLVNDCDCLKKEATTATPAPAPAAPVATPVSTTFTPRAAAGGGVAIKSVREPEGDPKPVSPVVYEYEKPVQPVETKPVQTSSSRGIYKVVDGDTAPIVARKVKMDVNRLREINKLEVGEQLVPGQSLVTE